ncbi:MAG: DUF1501 domain-containing protein [Actinobacteria bacterium]|nr:DUF1501 domain-containing protein [Actinomycetota bacterium]
MTNPNPQLSKKAFTRRQFVTGLGATVAVGAVGGWAINTFGANPNVVPTSGAPFVTTTTSGALTPSTTLAPRIDRTLVVIEMGGGNDALNTFVPYSKDTYFDLRRDMAIEEPLAVDAELGLHPSLAFVAQRYRAGQVAIVEGVGYPSPDLSHFASMATWWSGSPAGMTGTGWLGRYLDGTVGAGDPLAGVAVGPGVSPAMLAASATVIGLQDMSGLSPTLPRWVDTNDELMAMWGQFAPAPFDDTVVIDRVRTAIATTVEAGEDVDKILGAASTDQTQERTDETSGLGESMRVAAALAVSAVPPRVIYVHGWGDFDTHKDQANRQTELLLQLDVALQDFFTTVDGAGRGANVAVMTTSEFGRRAGWNGSGTDHGTASSHMVIGGAVNGGRYGEQASLTNLDTRGNLLNTLDTRSYYASVLGGWLKADHETLLDGSYEILPMFV